MLVLECIIRGIIGVLIAGISPSVGPSWWCMAAMSIRVTAISVGIGTGAAFTGDKD